MDWSLISTQSCFERVGKRSPTVNRQEVCGRQREKCLKYGMNILDINHTNINTAYIGLGSNLGNRQEHLQDALSRLGKLPTIEVAQVSSLYETDPIGVTDQPEFLNAVAEIRTSLTALELLDVLLNLENTLGRVRTIRWGPRVIDLDLLLYGQQQIDLPTLTVPHPRLHERAFVLVPLVEIAPQVVLPGQGKTVREIAEYFSGNRNTSGNIRRVGVV